MCYITHKLKISGYITYFIIKKNVLFDELKKFKELLDSGVITQEEFDEKKKALLGL